jgi:hypothetical protein
LEEDIEGEMTHGIKRDGEIRDRMIRRERVKGMREEEMKLVGSEKTIE